MALSIKANSPLQGRAVLGKSGPDLLRLRFRLAFHRRLRDHHRPTTQLVDCLGKREVLGAAELGQRLGRLVALAKLGLQLGAGLVSLVKQYSTVKPEDAEIIISYRNETAKLNNDKMLLHYKLINDSVSVPIICTTNKLQSKKIYKGFIYKITKNEDNIIELDGLYTISKKEFDKYFLTAYCINIHKLQGSDFKSIHYCEEDYSFIDNTVAYVVLSRIKTKNFSNTDIKKVTIEQNNDIFMFNLL